MALLSRSGLDAVRGSIGMGQGNIRNQNTRSNDMFYNNSPYAKSGNFNGGANSGNLNPFGGPQTGVPSAAAPEGPMKPEYASGGGLNQNPGGMQQQQQQSPWTPGWFNSFTGQTGNGPNNHGQQTPLFNGQPSSFTLGPNGQMIPTNPSSWKPADTSSNTQGPSGGWTTVAGDYPNGVPAGTPAGSRGAAPGQPGPAASGGVNAPNPSVPAGPTMPRFSTGTSIGNGADNPRRFVARPQLSMQQMQQFRTPYRQPNPSGFPPVDGTIDPIYPPPPQGV